MKRQTYVSYLEGQDGKMITFERWAYKRPSTIKEKLRALYTDYYSIYKEYIEKASYVTIYATPDGHNKIKDPVFKIGIDEFLKNSN